MIWLLMKYEEKIGMRSPVGRTFYGRSRSVVLFFTICWETSLVLPSSREDDEHEGYNSLSSDFFCGTAVYSTSRANPGSGPLSASS